MTQHDPAPVEHPDHAELAGDPLPLRGRVALVTGASRREGIGHAVARRLWSERVLPPFPAARRHPAPGRR